MYADDVKIFRAIHSPMDASKLQRDLDSLGSWAVEKKLKLNIKKCKYISFVKNHSPIKFRYKSYGEDLEMVSCIGDLGVIMDSKLQFTEHIEHIVNKTNRVLGFVCRTSTEFKNFSTLRNLYLS